MNMKEYHDCYFQLLSFEKNFRQFTQTKIGNSGLTFSHIIIMSYLHDHGGCGQKELTVTFNSSSAAMAVSVARLEEKGLIRKVVDDADKRNNLISLTEKGVDFLMAFVDSEGCQKTEYSEDIAEEEITKEELRHLARLQKKLFQQLKSVSERF